jgi:hypothetical protein
MGDLQVDGMIILKLILKDRVLWCGLNASGSGQGSKAGSFEHGNEYSGYKTVRECLEQLKDY